MLQILLVHEFVYLVVVVVMAITILLLLWTACSLKVRSIYIIYPLKFACICIVN